MPFMLAPHAPLHPPQLAPPLASVHGRSLQDYQSARMLPHIGEEYEFRITNRLLVEKITNPRRDKTIMDSLLHAAPKFLARKKHSAQSNHRSLLYRRKLQQKTQVVQAESFVQTEVAGKHGKSDERQGLRYSSQHEEKDGQGDVVMNRTCEMDESKVEGRRGCSIRDNFVGRIIKNRLRVSEEDSGQSQCPHSKEYPQILESRLRTINQFNEEGSSGQQRLKRIVRRSKYCREEKENQPPVIVGQTKLESAIPLKTAQQRL